MTFNYPKKSWTLPCQYHDHTTRIVDDTTPVVLSFDIQHLQIEDGTIVVNVLPLSETILERLALRQEGKDARDTTY